MANEISYAASLAITKDGLTVSATKSGALTLAGTERMGSIQAVGTSAEALAIGDLGSIGMLYLRNLDATNFVDVALDNGMTNVIGRLLPDGAPMLIPGPSSTLYLKADTAACSVQVVATEP